MKDIATTLLKRTSVRRYERQPIEAEKLQLIYEAIANSPTSYNGQQYSVIAIDDQPLKEKLYELTGQKQIKTCALFLIFCADYHKIECLAREKGFDVPPFRDTMDGIMVGTIDATIAMSNARIMAEALGLGCCCIGYVRTAAPQEVSAMLHLPQGTFIVCGLAIGYPREQPDIKPKQDEPLLIHRNGYHDEEITQRLQQYDEHISVYNRTRQGSTTDNDWCGHIAGYYDEGMNNRVLTYLKSQGCGIGHENDTNKA